jgi:biopolymer transport protein ExbB/TolQ|tara:strand:+ start:1577 stop:1843 length:267 start_codon:yes stop_codon:yes gene_type:complete
MAFKMKGFQAHANSPLKNAKNWLTSAKSWIKDKWDQSELAEIVENFGDYKDPAERRSKAQHIAHLMNPRNRSEEAVAYRAAQKNKEDV